MHRWSTWCVAIDDLNTKAFTSSHTYTHTAKRNLKGEKMKKGIKTKFGWRWLKAQANEAVAVAKAFPGIDKGVHDKKQTQTQTHKYIHIRHTFIHKKCEMKRVAICYL